MTTDNLERQKTVAMVQHQLGFPSEVFLYRQINGFRVLKPVVITGVHLNAEQFPFERVHFYTDLSLWDRLRAKGNRLCRLAGPNQAIGYAIFRKLEEITHDIVCFQMGFLPAILGAAIERIKQPVCIVLYGTDVNHARQNLQYRTRLLSAINRSAHVICLSDFIRNVAVKIGCPEAKLTRCYLGAPAPSEIPPLPLSPFRVLCVARMVPVKDHATLIRGFAEARRALPGLPMKLDLVSDGPLRKELEALAKELGADSNIEFHGVIDDAALARLISASSVYALTSRKVEIPRRECQEDGLPISLVEGAGMGRPLLGTRSGGIPEIVREGENGFLIEERDWKAAAKRIIELASNRALLEKMGARSRAIAEAEFNLETQNAELEKLLLEVDSANQQRRICPAEPSRNHRPAL